MTVRRLAVIATVALAASTFGIAGGTAGAAGTTLPLHETVNASTTLAKLHQTVTVPPGTFTGKLNLATGRLRGRLSLPPASTTISLVGVGLATATFSIVETKPVTGTVDLSTLAVTSHASFNVDVDSVEPLGLPVNLVGDRCGTSTPVTVTFSGSFSLTGPTALSGDYTIPPLQDCRALTPALNLVVAGPGNTFTASFSPAPAS